ncbi:MAG: AAA family ATPase [Theionarchaea archaeon]|nr:AAA family ATPase [Theionarchaea archaeon]
MIKSVKIKNWKAFDEKEVTFGKGINFIVAPNGSGKTSLLEAICIGLIGKVRTVDDERTLIREDKDQAEIVLDFELSNGELYRIERRIPRKSNHTAYVYNSEGEALAGNWKRATTFVEELLGIESFLIERIVYASEGDVDGFIETLSKKKELRKHIEKILGIDVMEGFFGTLDSLEKEIDSDIKKLRETSEKLEYVLPEEDMEELLKSKEILGHDMKELDRKLDQITEKINVNTTLLSEKKKKLDEILSLKVDIQEILCREISEDELIEQSQKTLEDYESSQDRINCLIQDLRTRRERTYGEISSLRKILDLISGAKIEVEEIRCPVCRKTLSQSEVDHIISETQEGITQKTEEIENLDREIQVKVRETKELSQKLARLRGMTIKARTLFSIDKYEAVKEYRNDIKSLDSKITEMKDARNKILNEKLESEKKRREIEEKVGRIRTASEFATTGKIKADLVIKAKEKFLTEILKKASRNLVDGQRRTNLEEISAEIAEDVNNILGSSSSRFSLDKITVDGHDRDYSQLSGGEKVAILAIIRAILCKHFSNAGFLLFDEPLEHLDLTNRRFLVDFLVDCCKEGSIQQFIITTFEESMIRKYLGEDQVGIIMI